MERSWFGTTRLLELEIGVMVAVVLMALLVIVARLARDPSEPAARWLAERARGSRLVTQQPPADPAGAVATATAGSTAADPEPRAPTPEWLDRLLGRTLQPEAGPAGTPRDRSGPESGRRVA